MFNSPETQDQNKVTVEHSEGGLSKDLLGLRNTPAFQRTMPVIPKNHARNFSFGGTLKLDSKQNSAQDPVKNHISRFSNSKSSLETPNLELKRPDLLDIRSKTRLQEKGKSKESSFDKLEKEHTFQPESIDSCILEESLDKSDHPKDDTNQEHQKNQDEKSNPKTEEKNKVENLKKDENENPDENKGPLKAKANIEIIKGILKSKSSSFVKEQSGSSSVK